MDKFTKDLANCSESGKCLFLDDMNGHTYVDPDYIDGDEYANDLIFVPDNYVSDTCMKRRNIDGKVLLGLCMSPGLRILNGRKIGGLFGSCTYFGPICRQPTLIDYGLTVRYNVLQSPEFASFV